MNPRHRRLLIPGLLVALFVVVVIASLTGRSDAAAAAEPTQVSVIDDPRIVEASGMVLSVQFDDLAYVMNDSGESQMVYAVRISTGAVVGATTVTNGLWTDSEALSIDGDGTLWVADTGDNLVQREDTALYSFAEPGEGDQTVEAVRYPVSYQGGSRNVEALLIEPRTGAKYLVSKGFVGADVFVLPEPLSPSGTVATPVASAPAAVTDGAFTPDGSRVLLRTYTDVRELDPSDWSEIRSIATPLLKQGETLAAESDGRTFLIGSEGESSPLIRVAIPLDDAPTSSVTPSPTPSPVPVDSNGDPRSSQGFAGRVWVGAGVGLLGLLGISWWVARGR